MLYIRTKTEGIYYLICLYLLILSGQLSYTEIYTKNGNSFSVLVCEEIQYYKLLTKGYIYNRYKFVTVYKLYCRYGIIIN